MEMTFSEKIEKYLSELGNGDVWRCIFIGQTLSVLLSGKCVLSTMLQGAIWQFPPTGQLIIPYAILFIIFMPILMCNGIRDTFSLRPWMYIFIAILDVEASFLLVLSQSGVGVALVGGAWSGQRLGLTHIGGATAGLMAVGCIVWADVEGAPIDGRNQLVGDMLCLGGSLLLALVTVIQEIILKKQSCCEYLAMIGLFGLIMTIVQTFVLEIGEVLDLYKQWHNFDMQLQVVLFCIIQTLFQYFMAVMVRDAGAVALHLSFVSADYYTLIAGIYLFQFKFHGLYLLSYFLAMVGVFMFCARKRNASSVQSEEQHTEELPQLVNDSMSNQDNLSMEFTVPVLDCIPLEGLEPPLSRDTTFTSFLGGPTNFHNTLNGSMNQSASNHTVSSQSNGSGKIC